MAAMVVVTVGCTSDDAEPPHRSSTTSAPSTTTTTPPASPTAPGSPGRGLGFTFDEGPGPEGFFTAPDHGGGDGVRVAVLARAGGQVVGADGHDGTGWGAGFPAHAEGEAGPAAVIRVVNSGTTDELDPGTRRLEMTADVHLDAATDSAQSSDNGDNVIQRGRFDDVTQYKLQVDHGRPSCRVKGRAGVVEVRGGDLDPARWYRLTCVRDGDRVTLTTRSSDGFTVEATAVATGPTGDLRPAAVTIPLSVGGKLADDGTVASSTDQFNGRLDNVAVRFG